MNYIAEPYVALVDQLLTGLTGGEAREQQIFFPATLEYALSRSFTEVDVNSIRLTGQSSRKFMLFVPGRDWKFTATGKIQFLADETTLVPANDAVWPDEGTDFYVSYYHSKSKQALLTDRNVGSLNRTLAEAFSRELAVLEKQLELVYQSGFVDTATGGALDQVVALLGLKRKGGDYATGIVRFIRQNVAPGDVFIPANTRLSTTLNPAVSFVTTTARTLRKGQLSVESSVRAEIAGADGVVAAAAIGVINKAILGINSVTNDVATLFSGEKESDEELRARSKSVMQRAGRATLGAISNAIVSNTGLKDNELKLVEDYQAHPGLVKLFIAREAQVELVKNINAALLDSRPAGVRFEHNLQSTIVESIEVPVSTEELREDTLADENISLLNDGFSFPVKCNVLVYSENTRLSGDQKNEIQSSIIDIVYEYIDNSSIGGELIFNQIVAKAMSVSGIRDIVLDLFIASSSSLKGKRNLIVPDGRRALFVNKLNDIQVNFVGSPVYFDFNFAIVLKPAATISGAELEIKKKLVSLFSTSISTIDGDLLNTILQPSDLYILDVAEQNWSVEYEQAGLTITSMNEPVDITIEEQAVLRKITVTEKV